MDYCNYVSLSLFQSFYPGAVVYLLSMHLLAEPDPKERAILSAKYAATSMLLCMPFLILFARFLRHRSAPIAARLFGSPRAEEIEMVPTPRPRRLPHQVAVQEEFSEDIHITPRALHTIVQGSPLTAHTVISLTDQPAHPQSDESYGSSEFPELRPPRTPIGSRKKSTETSGSYDDPTTSSTSDRTGPFQRRSSEVLGRRHSTCSRALSLSAASTSKVFATIKKRHEEGLRRESSSEAESTRRKESSSEAEPIRRKESSSEAEPTLRSEFSEAGPSRRRESSPGAGPSRRRESSPEAGPSSRRKSSPGVGASRSVRPKTRRASFSTLLTRVVSPKVILKKLSKSTGDKSPLDLSPEKFREWTPRIPSRDQLRDLRSRHRSGPIRLNDEPYNEQEMLELYDSEAQERRERLLRTKRSSSEKTDDERETRTKRKSKKKGKKKKRSPH